ncbi:MAG TPA: sulfatase [Opitutae bacterium]|nr:sulfatase [Opitutaceae bacterium]HCR29005.1 sulfatase [Opitutae bacterium]
MSQITRSPAYPSFAFQATLSLLLLAAGFILATDSQAQRANRPNIVFIFTDDHCQQALSAYDPSRMTTPHMDRIASQGMKFNRCYVTNAICGPSRAVIQTGKHSHLNGFAVNGMVFDGSQQTFPKLLQKAGYQTAVVGKWHLASTPQGYDYFDVLIGQGPYYNPPMRTRDLNGEVVTREHTGYTTDIITDKTMDWLKNGREDGKPFMLMYQHKAPHRNWQPGPKYLTWLDDRAIPEPETLYDDYSTRATPAYEQAMEIKAHLNERDLKLTAPPNLTPEQLANWNAAYGPKNEVYLNNKDRMSEKEIIQWKYQRYVKDYLRTVKSVDDGIGEVLDYLDDSGLAENTIVIYSSDQGWYLGEHGWFDKRWMYEESLKTPLLVKWPGVVEAGSINNDIVSNLDFAQTFLDLAGVRSPSDMQGASLVPIFKGKTPGNWRDSFYYHYYEFPGGHSVARHYGVSNGKHKLIHYYQKGEWELFDIEKDPNELNNVYDNPEYASIVKSLNQELNQLRKQYQVPDEDPDFQKLKQEAREMRRRGEI